MKKIFIVIIVFISTLCGSKVWAQESFEISDFNVKVTVRENNTYDIFEKVNVNFLEPSPRFKRVLPLDIYKEKAYLEMFECLNTEFELIKKVDKVTAVFGDNDILVAGERNYSYIYTLSLGRDLYEDKDRLFLNVLPDDSHGRILHAKIEISMPKDFDVHNLSVNIEDPEQAIFVPVLIKGNTIIIEATDEMLEGRKLNVVLDLPEGYFTQAKQNFKVFESLTTVANLTVLFLLLFSFLSCFIFKNNGIKQHREDPTGVLSVNPCEIAYVLDGEVTLQDIFANIMIWANQGKVGFTLLERTNKKDSLRIVKREELEIDSKPYEVSLFKLIFSEKDYISVGGLKKLLNRNKSKIEEEIHRFYEQPEEMVFSPRITVLREMIRFSASIPFIYITFKTFYVYTGQSGISFTLALICSLFFLLLSQSINTIFQKFKSYRLRNLTLPYWLSLLLGICMFMFFLWLASKNEALHTMEYLSMSASGILISIFSSLLVRRTGKGMKAYENIIAFKNYLLSLYDESIQDNSNIIKDFYQFLPYTLVTADMGILFKRLFDRTLYFPAWLEREGKPMDPYVHVDQIKEWINSVCAILIED